MIEDDEYMKVPRPVPWSDFNARIVGGAAITALDRLSIFSDRQYENFIAEWVSEFLEKEYPSVDTPKGANDKGRDIIGWLDKEGTKPRRWHNFQCKHYGQPLTYTDIYIEIGKILFYTFNSSYTIPEKHYFVCNKGVGPTLADDLRSNQDNLRRNLLLKDRAGKTNWEKYCQTKIRAGEPIKLEGKFKEYFDSFDFSIFTFISPVDLLNQHAKTRYHDQTFGTTIRIRGPIKAPPTKIESLENRYVAQLFESYSDHLGAAVAKVSDLQSRTENELVEHFEDSRIAFYSAESLFEFARDNLPPEQDHFTDLTTRILSGIKNTVRLSQDTGYRTLLAAVGTAQSLQLGQHVLEQQLRPEDREGICHQLANLDKVRWTKKKSDE